MRSKVAQRRRRLLPDEETLLLASAGEVTRPEPFEAHVARASGRAGRPENQPATSAPRISPARGRPASYAHMDTRRPGQNAATSFLKKRELRYGESIRSSTI
jgi:hypothetical protein